MSGILKIGGKTLATHDTDTNVAKIKLGSTSDVVLTDSQGNNVLSESGGVVTLTADAAIIEGSSSGDLVRITQTGSGNALVVEDSTNPDSTPFVVDSIGNVGIGRSPTDRLSIKNSTGNGTLDIITGTVTADSVRIQSGGSVTNYLEYRGYLGHVWFNDTTERMRIDSSGNVIIGSNPVIDRISRSSGNPLYGLVDKLLTISDSTDIAGHRVGIAFGPAGRVGSGIFANNISVTGSNEDTNLEFYTQAEGQVNAHLAMTIDYNRAVKIHNLNSSADVVTDTNGYLTTSSDARLKNEIGLITESGIEVIKQIIPKYFSWKEDENNKQHLGFFAQDIHPVLPEAAPRALKYTEVGRDENDEPILEQVLDENGDPDYQWGLATQPIVAMLVKAIQEQQTIIESQQSKIDALTARIEALENQPN